MAPVSGILGQAQAYFFDVLLRRARIVGARLRANLPPTLSWIFHYRGTEDTEWFELKRISEIGPDQQCLHSVPGIWQGLSAQSLALSAFSAYSAVNWCNMHAIAVRPQAGSYKVVPQSIANPNILSLGRVGMGFMPTVETARAGTNSVPTLLRLIAIQAAVSKRLALCCRSAW